MIFKDIAQGNNWQVYHSGIGNTKFMLLDTYDTAGTAATRWNNTTPSTTHITLGVSGHVNGPDGSGGYIAYVWTPKTGVSHFGTYTGNQSSPNKVTTGFRPRWIMVKTHDGSSAYAGWTIVDASRSTGWAESGTATITTVADLPPFYADNAKQEGQRNNSTAASQSTIDIYDDGFKFTGPGDAESNWTGQGYITAAFA